MVKLFFQAIGNMPLPPSPKN